MTLKRIARWLAMALAAGSAWLGLSASAEAIPLFARQTGHNCQACHISWPELTAYGREFKLNGYTFGETQPIPLAVAIMAQANHVADNTDHSTGSSQCTNCNKGELIQYSLFFGGRITENLGLFGQASSGEFPFGGGAASSAVGRGSLTLSADNTEFRYVHRFSTTGGLEDDTVVGAYLNNNMGMQEVWNTGPGWRYPYGAGGLAYIFSGKAQVAAPFLDLGGANGVPTSQQEVGMGAYVWLQKNIYAEVGNYRAPWGLFSWLAWGNNQTDSGDQPSAVMNGFNPYYRLAYSRDWGYNSLEVGVMGVNAHTYQCNPQGSTCTGGFGTTNNFHDIMFDTQYQYNKGEPWVFTGTASYEHESNDYTAWANNGGSFSTPRHTLNEFTINARAYYNRQYGANLGYQLVSGTSDKLFYGPGGSATGSPLTSSATLELNYLPLQNLRFALQYLYYFRLNGGGTNFDGAGNNATGQNNITAALWFVF